MTGSLKEAPTVTAPWMDVAILGAGPVGLDAALACADAGLPCTVYEAGAEVGAHVAVWGHVRLFTPWQMNLSPRMRAHLPDPPDDDRCPTGHEFRDTVLRPLAATPALAGRIRLRHRVRAVGRSRLLKHEEISTAARAAARFRLLVDGPDGEQVHTAAAVLDCTGSYSHPNPMGDGGIPAPGEGAADERIVRTLPPLGTPAERDRWRGSVLLVGAGKSAQTAAHGLAALPGTRLEWLVRAPAPDWGEIPVTRCPPARPSSTPPAAWPRATTTGSPSTPARPCRPWRQTATGSGSGWTPRAVRGRCSWTTC